MSELDVLLDQTSPWQRAAAAVKKASDVNLPQLRLWNDRPCNEHDVVQEDCRRCGVIPKAHERIGASWMYFVQRGMLGDSTGLGKTIQCLLLIDMLKERGELTDRALVVVQAPAVLQWLDEFTRCIPALHVEPAIGTKDQRIARYMTNWDVVVISAQTLLRDAPQLFHFSPGMIIADDVDPLRHHSTQIFQTINRFARRADRAYVINATPLQIELEEAYCTGVPLGSTTVFGSLRAFQTRYVQREKVYVWNKKRRKRVVVFKTVGYKHMDEFKQKFSPMYLRRTYDDVDGVDIPDIAPPEDVWLELHPAQRKKYDDLQEGVLRVVKEKGAETKDITYAFQQWGYGSMICSGLQSLGEEDGPQASVKLDWFVRKIKTDWIDEKVVAHIRYKGTIVALQERLKKEGIGMEAIWSEEGGSKHRMAQQNRFWDDPACRVMVGTSAIERSLNLQVSRLLVNFDVPALNPARVRQILGRVRRMGSKHKSIYVFNLYCRDTQESSYPKIIAKRAALADFVFDDEGDGFFKKLSPLELLLMIGGGRGKEAA